MFAVTALFGGLRSNPGIWRLRYLWRMLVTAFAAVFGMAVAFGLEHAESLPVLLWQAAFWLVGVNLVVSTILFSPINRFLHGDDAARAQMDQRIHSLAKWSGLWTFALLVATIVSYKAMPQDFLPVFSELQWGAMARTVVHYGVFAAYFGLAGYLLVIDFSTSLRWHCWQHGVAIVPRSHRLMGRLALLLVVVAMAPMLIVVSDQWGGASGGMAGAVTNAGYRDDNRLHQVLQMDLLGALFLTALAIFLMARSFSRPVGMLISAMQQVDAGDLGVRVPVVSDDEFGLISSQFDRMLDGLRERDRMRKTFGRFVPEQLAARLIASEGVILPTEREATVLFADIENFTALSSRMEPRAVLSLLNACFEALANIIHAHGGVITQFQGDGVLASFNLPASDPEHAGHAVQAALAIDEKLQRTVFEGGLRLRTRIGVSTGSVVGGMVGGGERLGYTVHGSTVNLAARLELLNKQFGTRVLVSARTAELAGDSIQWLDRGPVAVRGFEELLQVFEPVGRCEGGSTGQALMGTGARSPASGL